MDAADPAKQAIARDLLERTRNRSQGVISAQVQLELFRTVTKKLDYTKADARVLVLGFEQLHVVYPRAETVHEALDICQAASIGIWDAMILASALQAKCSVVYSEDMQHGFQCRGLTVKDPFAR